jgi:hypothetical protein
MGRYWVANSRDRGGHWARDDWLTPKWMLAALGPFDLDPCAPVTRPWRIARKHLTIEDDGLSAKWSGTVWLNPPYGRNLGRWVTKLAAHGDGIAVIPVRSTDAAWFHDAVWGKSAAVLFVQGRLRFCSPDGVEGGSCPHSSILIAWGERSAQRLTQAEIRGHLVANERPRDSSI